MSAMLIAVTEAELLDVSAKSLTLMTAENSRNFDSDVCIILMLLYIVFIAVVMSTPTPQNKKKRTSPRIHFNEYR